VLNPAVAARGQYNEVIVRLQKRHKPEAERTRPRVVFEERSQTVKKGHRRAVDPVEAQYNSGQAKIKGKTPLAVF